MHSKRISYPFSRVFCFDDAVTQVIKCVSDAFTAWNIQEKKLILVPKTIMLFNVFSVKKYRMLGETENLYSNAGHK